MYERKLGEITDKLAINCQNFARVRLKLKFTFICVTSLFTRQTSIFARSATKILLRGGGEGLKIEKFLQHHVDDLF